MRHPPPINAKYRNGRRIMLTGGILLSITHICGYLPSTAPNNLPINWTRITAFIPAWVWVTLWGITLFMAVIELIRGKGRYAISCAVGMFMAAAGAYACSYVMTVLAVGWGSREWFYFGLFAGMALIVTGLLTKVGAQKHKEPTSNG